MPYAADGQISTDPIEGGIEITEQQYQDALAGMQSGKRVVIEGGAMVIKDPEPPAPPEPPTVPELKAAKLSELTGDCLAAIDGGFEFEGHTYDSDLIGRMNIIGTATGVQAGIELPAEFTWRTADNVNVPIDGAGVIALGAALLEHVNTQYARSWALKAMVQAIPDDAADAADQIAAITWESQPV